MKPEQRFSRQFKQAFDLQCLTGNGGFAFRLETSHTFPGLPDWCCIIPGKVFFVELKVSPYKVSPTQIIAHAIIRKLNIPVFVLTKYKDGITIDSNSKFPLQKCIEIIVEKMNHV